MAISEVRKVLEYLLTGLPVWSTRNFSKFQEMSERRTGLQMMNFGSVMRLQRRWLISISAQTPNKIEALLKLLGLNRLTGYSEDLN